MSDQRRYSSHTALAAVLLGGCLWIVARAGRSESLWYLLGVTAVVPAGAFGARWGRRVATVATATRDRLDVALIAAAVVLVLLAQALGRSYDPVAMAGLLVAPAASARFAMCAFLARSQGSARRPRVAREPIRAWDALTCALLLTLALAVWFGAFVLMALPGMFDHAEPIENPEAGVRVMRVIYPISVAVMVGGAVLTLFVLRQGRVATPVALGTALAMLATSCIGVFWVYSA